MKLRKVKKQTPAEFRKQMYKSYKANMRFYGKPIKPLKEWLIDVLTQNYPKDGQKSKHK